MAKPTVYSEDMANEILIRLADGQSIRKICADDHIASKSTVLLWVVDGKHEDFSRRYELALQCRGHLRAEEIEDHKEALKNKKLDASAANVLINACQWQAGREARKRYGNKQEHEHTGKDGGAIETKDVTENEAARRIAFLLTKATQQK